MFLKVQIARSALRERCVCSGQYCIVMLLATANASRGAEVS